MTGPFDSRSMRMAKYVSRAKSRAWATITWACVTQWHVCALISNLLDDDTTGRGLLGDQAEAEHLAGQLANDLGAVCTCQCQLHDDVIPFILLGQLHAALETRGEGALASAASVDLRFQHNLRHVYLILP